MITEHDLQEAIAECKGQRNPNASTCIKLASYLTIQKELYGTPITESSYSFSSGYDASNLINYESGTEFSRKINGKDQKDVLPVIDELMDLLHALYPKIYNSVLRKL